MICRMIQWNVSTCKNPCTWHWKFNARVVKSYKLHPHVYRKLYLRYSIPDFKGCNILRGYCPIVKVWTYDDLMWGEQNITDWVFKRLHPHVYRKLYLRYSIPDFKGKHTNHSTSDIRGRIYNSFAGSIITQMIIWILFFGDILYLIYSEGACQFKSRPCRLVWILTRPFTVNQIQIITCSVNRTQYTWLQRKTHKSFYNI
jgi:hypothetical protein